MKREFFIDTHLVRVHFIIVMIRWTGLAPWEFAAPMFIGYRTEYGVVVPTVLPAVGRRGHRPGF